LVVVKRNAPGSRRQKAGFGKCSRKVVRPLDPSSSVDLVEILGALTLSWPLGSSRLI
jgi:hypothetical protein